MSAIYGLIYLDKEAVVADELAGMDRALAIHGMDGGGFWQQGHVGLGQRLLRITPQDCYERQPCISTNGEIYLVSDGRIHNRPELIDALHIDIPTAELSDGVIILHAYQRWGRACVDHLIGTFTFALWDTGTQQLLIARSAIASPALFFHTTPRTLAFATMPKGLFALPFISRNLDEQYLADYLANAGSDPTATFYQHIQRLLPGQMLVMQDARWSVETFWQPDRKRTIHFTRDEEYVEAFDEIFARVVQDHLRSHTPVGVMMSGGFDSTSVAAVAAQHYQRYNQRLATYTEVPRTGFDGAIIPGRYADETPYVQAMAQHYFNIDLNLIQTDGENYLDGIDRLFAASEVPFPNASNRVWYEAILRTAQAQGVRLLLTGAGGNLTISWNGDGLLTQLVGSGRWREAWQESRALTRHGKGLSAPRTLFMQGLLPYLPDWIYWGVDRWRSLGDNYAGQLENWRQRASVNPDFAREHHVEERALLRKSILRSRPSRDRRARREFTLLAGVRRGDGLPEGYQAHYGVTTSDPTSDVRLVEFCLALPEGQYQRNGTTRWLIRRAMAEQLPPAILNNRGRGLQAADWYERLYNSRGRIKEELARIEQCDLARRALDLPRLWRLVEEMDAGSANATKQLKNYRGVLEQGLMTGSFIRWAKEGK